MKSEFSVMVGRHIAQLRKARGMTQGELAEKIQVEVESVSRIETGHTTPPLPRLIAIADVLDCSLEELLRCASKRKSDQLIVLEELLLGLNACEREYAVKLISDFATFTRKNRPLS